VANAGPAPGISSSRLKEGKHIAQLQLPVDDDLTFRINAMNLKNRLRNVEPIRNCLHGWRLRIVAP
jgi:hypothetical protein